MWQARLERAEMRLANLEGVGLEGANLQGANLWASNLEGVKLKKTNLKGAEMRRIKNLTQKQINDAFIDENTKLPDYRVCQVVCVKGQN